MQRKFRCKTMQYLGPVLMASLILLAGCSPTPTKTGETAAVTVQNDVAIQDANELLKQNKKREAAQAYFNAANGFASPQKERVILQAAELAASTGDNDLTNNYLAKIDANNLDGENKGRYAYVRALTALQNNNADAALQQLPDDTATLSPALREKVNHIRQRAIAMGGKAAKSGGKTTVQAALIPNNTNYIGVLLPQSGPLGGVSKDIYQGIQTARNSLASNTTVQLYDVSNGGAVGQYKRAVADGADIIVGPLDKESLAELLANPQTLSRPLLSLNYLTQNRHIPGALYQFGLLPEDEARQVAQFAASRGQRTAIVMVPASSWGARIAQAFRTSYQNNGGQVLVVQQYADTQSKSYTQAVRSALANSQGRASMVFMAATPSQARILGPLLADQASNLPVYATSHIFSGKVDPSKDRALDGITYTEIPWVMENLQSGRLNASTYPRMFALGMDAFLIAKNLPNIARNPSSRVDGKTGNISLAGNRQVQRSLLFATFDNGIPRPLGQ